MTEPYYETKLGKLYHGDCLGIMAGLGSVDLVLTDPPYGTTSCKWDSIIPLGAMWTQLKYLIKPNGVIAITASQPFTSILVTSNIDMFRHEWIWIKNRGSNFANTVREPMKEHETVLIFSRGKWVYNRQMQPRTGAGLERIKYNCKFESKSDNYREFEGRSKNKLSKLRVPSTWQKFNTEVGLHPTQKPVLLMEYLTKTYTNEDEIVLDFAVGSGTTAVACEKLKRRWIGIEKEEKYCEIAAKRIEAEASQLKLFK